MPSLLLNKQTLLQTIATYLSDDPIIVEAGAFDGKDTKKLSLFWPQAKIYAFEPVPAIYTRLKSSTSMLANVHCYSYALSNKSGLAPFYLAEKVSKPGQPGQAGSLHKPHKRREFGEVIYKEAIDVPCITLDEWAVKEKIQKVDFLWFDMQGHELCALQGGLSLLKTVQVIYAEVNSAHAYENQPTYEEVVAWLARHEFEEIGRDFDSNKKWLFGNVLFIKNNINPPVFTFFFR